MAPEHINPAGIPVDQLDPETVVTAAGGIKKVGKKVSKQGAAVQRTWHGLAHSYEAPEDSKLLTIMDPVKSTTHTFSENTALVAKALNTYAATEELVKAELKKIKAEAETFVASIENGVTRLKAGGTGTGAGTSHETIPWHEDTASVEKNNALIGRLEAQLTALKEAQQTCASTIYGIIGFTPPSTGPQPGGSTETTDQNYVPPWGQRVERTKNCGEKAVGQVGHALKGFFVNSIWNGAVKPILTMDAMLYLGYDAKTGEWFDWKDSLPQYGEANAQMLSGLVKLGVGISVLTSPGMFPVAMNMKGPLGDFLRSSVTTTKDFGKSIIAYDTFKKGNIAEGIGEAVGNIGTFFIPGVGEVGVAVKGAATASKLARAGMITTEVLANGSRVTKFTAQGIEALRLGKIGTGPLSDLAKVRPNLRMPDGSKLVDFDFGKVRIPDTDPPKIPDNSTGTKHLPGQRDIDLPPSRTGTHPSTGDHHSSGDHSSQERTQPHDTDTPTDHGDRPGTDHQGANDPVVDHGKAAKGLSQLHEISGPNKLEFDKDVDLRKGIQADHTDALRKRNELAKELKVPTKELNKMNLGKTIERLEQNASTPADFDKIDRLAELADNEYVSGRKLNEASERLGMFAGRDHLTKAESTIIVGAKDVAGRPHELDLIGLSSDGKTLTVVEAKGGDAARLGTRTVDGVKVKQGSTTYLNDLLHRDRRLAEYLKNNRQLAQDLASGDVRIKYELVHARSNGRVRVSEFTIEPKQLKLTDLVDKPVPAGR